MHVPVDDIGGGGSGPPTGPGHLPRADLEVHWPQLSQLLQLILLSSEPGGRSCHHSGYRRSTSCCGQSGRRQVPLPHVTPHITAHPHAGATASTHHDSRTLPAVHLHTSPKTVYFMMSGEFTCCGPQWACFSRMLDSTHSRTTLCIQFRFH